MRTSDFDYYLPKELIAQFPPDRRDESRLMVLERSTQRSVHTCFRDVVRYLRRGDSLVINETKVLPTRLWGRKTPTGGKLEVFLLREHSDHVWEALVNPGRRAPVGTQVSFGEECSVGTIVDRMSGGKRLVQFEDETRVEELLNRWGEIPLPPYINRKPVHADRERYQTVYAKKPGAVAAPTAGLHFTEALIAEVASRGVSVVRVLLHVGLGTFRPVTTEDPRQYAMEAEYFEISTESAERINKTKRDGGRIVAVGTTTVRALESAAGEGNRVRSMKGWAETFIYPPYTFRVIDCLLTNFHLPRSTLLMLVSAFAGRELILEAYRKAIAQRYRFFSYGDAMLIL